MKSFSLELVGADGLFQVFFINLLAGLRVPTI